VLAAAEAVKNPVTTYLQVPRVLQLVACAACWLLSLQWHQRLRAHDVQPGE
jgi:hypothetical protein